MEEIRQYVLSVAAAAIVVAIVTGLTAEKSSGGMILRLMGGLFLAFTVLGPVAELSFGDVGEYFAAFSSDGEQAAADGKFAAREAVCSYIKSETESYILDKADAFGAALSVEVKLTEGGIPDSVRLRGSVSPYAKACLENMMAEDLGISKENQTWIG
ncbi:MAG: hypothetical protein J6B95_05105 [Oscillospiraceae bacterium]|nr:hypothetical protein [Oscillospiraceae bacterium]